jgi:hypothetical protein
MQNSSLTLSINLLRCAILGGSLDVRDIADILFDERCPLLDDDEHEEGLKLCELELFKVQVPNVVVSA